MPKATCLKCWGLIPLGESYCVKCKPPRKPYQKRKSVERGFTREYRRNRATILSLSTICCLCGKAGADSADHVRPRGKGGSNRLTNLIPAHLSPCNSRRKDSPLTDRQLERAREFQEGFAHILQSG